MLYGFILTTCYYVVVAVQSFWQWLVNECWQSFGHCCTCLHSLTDTISMTCGSYLNGFGTSFQNFWTIVRLHDGHLFNDAFSLFEEFWHLSVALWQVLSILNNTRSCVNDLSTILQFFNDVLWYVDVWQTLVGALVSAVMHSALPSRFGFHRNVPTVIKTPSASHNTYLRSQNMSRSHQNMFIYVHLDVVICGLDDFMGLVCPISSESALWQPQKRHVSGMLEQAS